MASMNKQLVEEQERVGIYVAPAIFHYTPA